MAGMIFWRVETTEVDQIEVWWVISRSREYGLFENDFQMTSNDQKTTKNDISKNHEQQSRKLS